MLISVTSEFYNGICMTVASVHSDANSFDSAINTEKTARERPPLRRCACVCILSLSRATK